MNHLLLVLCFMTSVVSKTLYCPQESHSNIYVHRDYSYSLQQPSCISATTCIYYWHRNSSQQRKFQPNAVCKIQELLAILLVIDGIETNAGPTTSCFLCPICDKSCDWGQRAIACDECNHWYHASCTGIDSKEYSFLANKSVSWYCIVCHSHNHSTILVDLIDSAESNTFSVLSPTVSIDASNSSLSDASFGEP